MNACRIGNSFSTAAVWVVWSPGAQGGNPFDTRARWVAYPPAPRLRADTQLRHGGASVTAHTVQVEEKNMDAVRDVPTQGWQGPFGGDNEL